MSEKRGPWTVLESRDVFRNGHLRVRRDAVIDPAGKRGEYATVHLRPGVAVLPFDGDRVFLTRQFRFPMGREIVEAVGGAVDDGATPLSAAQKELKEELGITAASWEPAGLLDIDTSTVMGPVHLFLAAGLTFGPSRCEDTERIRPVDWPLTEAVDKAMAGELTHAPTLALLLKALWRPRPGTGAASHNPEAKELPS